MKVEDLDYVKRELKPGERPVLGARGERRMHALKESDGFRAIEPVMRVVAQWASRFRIDDLRAANALVVVAGMEGALPSVVAGLVSRPVIAVPTSVGWPILLFSAMALAIAWNLSVVFL